VAGVPNSALSLSQHRDEDASENAQREALKKERPRREFAPEVAKLILGASLYDRSNGPNSSPLPPTRSRQSCRIFALYLCRRHAWTPFRPWVPDYCADTPLPPVPLPCRRRTRLSKPAAHGEPSDVQVKA
jgi:hypothetical protein